MASINRPAEQLISEGRFVRQYNPNTGQTLRVLAPYYRDFYPTTVVATSATAEKVWAGSMWPLDTSATGAGTNAVILRPNILHGYTSHLQGTNNNQAEDTGLIHGTAANTVVGDVDINYPGGIEFEVEFKASTAPVPAAGTAVDEVSFGLISAFTANDGSTFPLDQAIKALAFRIGYTSSAQTVKIVCDDGTTDLTQTVSSSVTFSNGSVYHCSIRWNSINDIEFWVNGARLAPTTALSMAGISTTKLARYILLSKKSGTTTSGILLNRMQIWGAYATS